MGMGKRVLQDHYFKLAKEEGYLARSAYKMKQIQEEHGLIRRGHGVLDLGCAPGSWLQVLVELVGLEKGKGMVVGIDRREVRLSFGERCVTVVGDMREVDAMELLGPLREVLGEKDREDKDRLFDVVVSDMAPDTGGPGDAERSVHLCRDVLALLPRVLRDGGSLAMKVLEGSEFADLLKETRAVFREVKGFKPKASRDVSKELYVVGRRYRPGTREVRDAGKKLPPHLRFSERDFR